MSKKTKKETKTQDKDQQQSQKKTAEKSQNNKSNTQTAKIEELKQMLKDEKDKYLRLYAEFENYRKRTAKEKLELFETAAEKVIKNLLPVLDDFERAIEEMKKSHDDEMVKGVILIYDKFKKTLEKEGLKDILVQKGDSFDPDIHEAIAQVPVEDEKMKDKIVDVVEKGYQLGPKNIRFPKVVTGR